jgi:hypothetical protein
MMLAAFKKACVYFSQELAESCDPDVNMIDDLGDYLTDKVISFLDFRQQCKFYRWVALLFVTSS